MEWIQFAGRLVNIHTGSQIRIVYDSRDKCYEVSLRVPLGEGQVVLDERYYTQEDAVNAMDEIAGEVERESAKEMVVRENVVTDGRWIIFGAQN